MKSKKGAVELSMTTIIVIVIGITLLTLGLTWVRSSLGNVMDLTDQAFDLSDQEIEDMFANSDELLKILPNSVDMKKSKSAEVGMILYNLGESQMTVQAQVQPIAAGVPLSCKFGDTLTATSKEYTLMSGASEKIKIEIKKTEATTIGTGGCDVTLVTNPPTAFSTSEQVLVEVTG